MAGRSLIDRCMDATDTVADAFTLAFKIERWKQIAACELDPEPDEVLPAEVWRARERTQREAA